MTKRAPRSPTGHTPVPDGKSGPFRRVAHAKYTASGVEVLAYDPRCPECVSASEEERAALIRAVAAL